MRECSQFQEHIQVQGLWYKECQRLEPDLTANDWQSQDLNFLFPKTIFPLCYDPEKR